MNTNPNAGISNADQNEQRRFQISKQDWANFRFFACGDDVRSAALNLLKERDYLLPNEQPNLDKITAEAEFFAKSLVERLITNRQMRRFGIQRIADKLREFVKSEDWTAMYFYITNIYGMVRWYAPYNLQRLPVHPTALIGYLSVFSETFVDCMNKSAEIGAVKSYEEVSYLENHESHESEGLEYGDD
jgi:hypothetical protein